MIRGVTAGGFAYEIDERRFKDIRFLRAARKVERSKDSDDTGEGFDASLEMFLAILGNDQESKLEEHIEKTHDGILEADTYFEAMRDILAAASEDKEAKKS